MTDTLNQDEHLTWPSAISPADLSANISESHRKLREICGYYKKGFISRDEALRGIAQVIQTGYYDFLGKHALSTRLRPQNQETWKRFCEDFQSWKSGQEPCSRAGSPWLKYDRDLDPEGPRKRAEASGADRTRFFELMEAFHIPVEFYRPVPEGTIYPDGYILHYDEKLTVGFELWENNGGLLSEGFRLGDTITLTDRFGLKSVIKVTEHLTSFEEQKKRRIFADYIGIGTIEGYTTSRERQIEISVRGGKVISLSARVDEDDMKLFHEFPLWQEAHEHTRKREEIWNGMLEELLQFFQREE